MSGRRWLLDTDVLSELRRGDQGAPQVRRWLQAHASDEHFISALAVGEIRRGIELKRRRDPAAADALERWLREVEANFGARILAVDAEVADRWGRLGVPDPLPAIDGLIAATALVHGLVLVTRNVRDVARSGVEVFDPFV